uniref:Uncharacterized protein n=1 Tax=Setaria italica TaxID=4555 RepID=K3ZKE7_SETIT
MEEAMVLRRQGGCGQFVGLALGKFNSLLITSTDLFSELTHKGTGFSLSTAVLKNYRILAISLLHKRWGISTSLDSVTPQVAHAWLRYKHLTVAALIAKLACFFSSHRIC